MSYESILREEIEKLKEFRKGIYAANRESAERLRDFMHELTLGKPQPIPGSPFARNKPLGAPFLPINTRNSKYRTHKSLRMRELKTGEFSLYFTSPAAPFVLNPGGTEKMVDRHFWETVYDEAKILADEQVALAYSPGKFRRKKYGDRALEIIADYRQEWGLRWRINLDHIYG